MKMLGRWMVCVVVLCVGLQAQAQQQFSELVGPVRVQPVKAAPVLEVPYITWGGDVATFHANGGLTTRSGSIYDKHGLKIKLTAGDDFIGQVRNYL